MLLPEKFIQVQMPTFSSKISIRKKKTQSAINVSKSL